MAIHHNPGNSWFSQATYLKMSPHQQMLKGDEVIAVFVRETLTHCLTDSLTDSLTGSLTQLHYC